MAFTPDEIDRYARHLVLREIGGPGQQRLKAARVLVIGVGGLGAPASLYLAAAGVGQLSLVDGDVVSLSNLQRQILFETQEVGMSKAVVGAERLSRLNPEIRIEPVSSMATGEMLEPLLKSHDVVLDGTDSFQARFLVNAAATRAGVPLISGAIGRWSGQIGVFAGQPCYQCFVPEAPEDADTCFAVGVVGALAGVIGSMMALEAVRLITAAGEPSAGRLMVYDALSLETRTLKVRADPACPVCGNQL